MNEMVNFNIKKLSKQQKAILEYLSNHEHWYCKIREVSWFIAKKFNQDDTYLGSKNRWYQYDSKRHKENLTKQTQEAIEKNDEILTKITALESMFYADNLGRVNNPILTNLHKASFYRSIKRLRIRGLIHCFDEAKIDIKYFEEYKEVRWMCIKHGKSHYKYIRLSEDYFPQRYIVGKLKE